MIKKNTFIKLLSGSFLLVSLLYASNLHANTDNAREVEQTPGNQQRTIIGIVSENGEPLIGATVRVKETSEGTITDIDGNFTLKAAPGSTLVISYIGYITQEVKVGKQTAYSIELKSDTQTIDEVVVVGYGSLKKSDITGSMNVVGEKSLRQIPSANIASALQGMGSGVDIQKSNGSTHPSSVPTIRIRGERSLTGGNDPLIIVDGIPFDADMLNDISPDDIVSVSVLKDASSTAIYGSRGSNGVLLITTSRGSKEQKATVRYNGYYGFNKALGKYDMMNSEELTQMRKWAKYNGMSEGTYTGIDDPTLMDEGQNSIFQGLLADERTGYYNGTNVDWQDLMYQSTSTMTNHQLSLSGGGKTNQYAVSLGYYKATGIYDLHSLERYTVKLSFDQWIGKYVKVGISSMNTFTKSKGEDVNPMDQALRMSPMLSPYLENGELRKTVHTTNQMMNPLADLVPGAIQDMNTRWTTFTTGYLEVDFTHGFKYKLNAGIQLSPSTRQKYYASGTTKQKTGASWAMNQSTDIYDYTIENLLTYDKKFKKHSINATAMFSTEEKKHQWFQLDYTDIPSDQVGYYGPKTGQNHKGDGSYSKWNLLSYMGRINYVYDDKYLVTATIRSDGSSRLAKGNKWQTFPSAAVAWNIKNENFLKDVDAISSLKLRASYGTVGNTTLDPYSSMGSMSSNKYTFGSQGVIGYYPTGASNSDLVWEKTSTMNFGLDYGLFNGRITGSLEVYKQYTTDLIMDFTPPASTGISEAIKYNVGKTENFGVEFNLKARILEGDGDKTFSWDTDFNIFLNRSKIKSLTEGVDQIISKNWFVGKAIGVFYDYRRLGIWQNTPEDIALAESFGLKTSGTESVIGTVKVADISGPDGVPDGVINDNDREIVGKREPKFEGGMTNTFGYKNFDFSFVTYFRVGGKFRSEMHNGWMNTLQGGAYNNLKVNYWTPDNNENYWPKPNRTMESPKYLSTLSLMDASYLKIRTISLGYTVPKSALSKLGIGSLRAYTTVSNPFTFFSKYMKDFGGLDPETTGNLGKDGTPPLPAMWSMIFGLNVTF
ncbi:MAG: TonB-dependent receptor [Bacteroides sp.]|nr:TonB-dependent receptor [Bacteroides sp.]